MWGFMMRCMYMRICIIHQSSDIYSSLSVTPSSELTAFMHLSRYPNGVVLNGLYRAQ